MRKHHSIVAQGSAEWPWVNFLPSEIASKGDGTVVLTRESRDAMDKLKALRTKLGHPLLVLSGHRDAAHNIAIGGGSTRQAVDVAITNFKIV